MADNISNNLAKILSTVFEKEISSTDNISMENCSEWTSLKHIELIVMLEEEFEISFNPEIIPELTSQERILNELVKQLG